MLPNEQVAIAVVYPLVQNSLVEFESRGGVDQCYDQYNSDIKRCKRDYHITMAVVTAVSVLSGGSAAPAAAVSLVGNTVALKSCMDGAARTFDICVKYANRDSNWRHFLGDRCRIVRCDPVPGRIFTSERLLWALAVVIGIELLVSQVISWEVSVWVAMCGDGLLALGTLGLFLARIYRNREVDWLLLFVAVMMVLLAANHWEIAQSHPIAG